MILATHDGVFHPDDVFAYAILKLALGNDHILKRTRNISILNQADISWDVGGGKYDHHFTNGKPYRDNSDIPYSSAGLIWRDYGIQVIKILVPNLEPYYDSIWENLDKNLFKIIDILDNGYTKSTWKKLGDCNLTINQMISDLNPSWNEDNSPEFFIARFKIATDLVINFLTNRIKSAASVFEAREKILNTPILNYGVMELPVYMPTNGIIFESKLNVNFIIYPEIQQWRVLCVPTEIGSYNQRVPLPKKFAGLSPTELKKISPFKDLTFVHAAQFTAACGSRDTAFKLCEMAFKNESK